MLTKIFQHKIKIFIFLIISITIGLSLKKTTILMYESQNNQQNQLYEQNKNIIYSKLNYLSHIISQQENLKQNGTDTNKIIKQELNNIMQGSNVLALKLYDLNGNLIQQNIKQDNSNVKSTSLLFNLLSENKLLGFLVAEINLDKTNNKIQLHVKNEFYAMFLLIFLSSVTLGLFVGFNLRKAKK